MKKADLVYYLRALLGFIVGFLSAILSGLDLPPLPWLPGLLIAVAIYPLTYKALRTLEGLSRKEAAFTGIEAYFFMWLFSWTLWYTILNYVA